MVKFLLRFVHVWTFPRAVGSGAFGPALAGPLFFFVSL